MIPSTKRQREAEGHQKSEILEFHGRMWGQSWTLRFLIRNTLRKTLKNIRSASTVSTVTLCQCMRIFYHVLMHSCVLLTIQL